MEMTAVIDDIGRKDPVVIDCLPEGVTNEEAPATRAGTLQAPETADEAAR